MIFLRILHLLTGYAAFSASGGFPERFVNLCAGMQIRVWDVLPRDGVLYGKTDVRDYRKLRTAAKRAGMRLRIRKKRGLPFVLHKRRDRFGLMIAAAVFVLLLCVLGARIWRIDVESDNAWTRETVRAALQEIGVTEGVRTSSVDASRMERELLLRLPDVEWIALNVRGSALHVELRDAEPMLPQDDYAHPCHIVASKDGFLCRLEVYEGAKAVNVRTAVQKGQLLVSGAVEHANSPVTFHHAKGYAEAETQQQISVSLPANCSFPTVDSKRFRVRVELFSVRVPLGDPRPQPDAAYFVYRRFCTAGDVRLPLSCTVFQNVFFTENRTLSARQQTLWMLSKFGEQAALNLRACRILRADVQASRKTCTGTFRTLENIGAEQNILME